MQNPEQLPLRGVARSLDDLFGAMSAARALPPLLAVGAVPDDVVDLSAPLPSLVSAPLQTEALQAVAQQSPPDAAEERRARAAAAAGSLAQAVDALVRDHGDREELAQRIREATTTLREENALEPMIEATELLARSAPTAEPSELAIQLAHLLTTPAVSAGLALRLAAASDEPRRSDLIGIFRRLDEEAAVALGGALETAADRSARRNLMDGLVAMGDLGLAQAMEMVKDGKDWGVVRNGVTVLGELGGERAVAQLMDTIEHHKPQVRRETIAALARIGGEGAVLLLTGRLLDDDEGVRAAAVRALGNLGSERVGKTLLARLEEEQSDEVTQEILRALGQIGDPGAVPAIEKCAVGSFFSKRTPEVRIAAYRALSLIGTPKAKSLIQAAAEDKDTEVRAACRALAAKP